MFTDPPLAHVGLSQREAECQDARRKAGDVPRAQAGEVTAVAQTAMMTEMPLTRLREADLAHRPSPRDWASCS
jgi:pyruvate/2-oxoglutarate dehydrogenase complex dihydrolipoamide dehydrogenase (E3) component